MEFINFDCPECGQNLDAPSDMAGQQIECPNCSHAILIPSADSVPSPAARPSAPNPPPPPAGGASSPGGDLKKSATVRLDLPSDFAVPKPKPRMYKIKRQED